MNHRELTDAEAEVLLHRYFAAETSLAEEERLRAYFRSGQVPDHLRGYDPLFGYWDLRRARRSARRRSLPRRALAAAGAAAAILAGVLFLPGPGQPPAPAPTAAATTTIDWSKYEVTDPNEAYRVLRGALGTASEQLRRGPAITVRQLRAAKDVIE